MNISKQTINSIKIGSLSITVYLVSYVARNILSVITPLLTENGIFTKEYVGMLLSVYLGVYAAGQLLNGVMGDRVHPKNMIFFGCAFSGCGMLLFPYINVRMSHLLCFALLGFGLSMLRGPLMKMIAENTPPKIARKICVLFSAASFAGPLVASVLSVIFDWKVVFAATALFTISMAVLSYYLISVLEKRGSISFQKKKENIFKGIKSLFTLDGFLFYLIVGAISEITASSITFWIPTYLSEYLSLSQKATAVVFSLISLIKIGSPFLCIFLYERVITNDNKLVGLMFAVSAALFGGLIFTRSFVFVNVLLLILVKVTTGCAATTLWSIYIPGLAKYGKVSTGNGVFDFSGYVAASIANLFFSGAIETVGWSGLIIVWTLIMVLGFVCALVRSIYKRRSKRTIGL